MGRASEKFDRQLFSRELGELSDELQLKSDACERATSLPQFVDCHLALLRAEWLKGVDRICRQVWGGAVTPDFVREILVPEATRLIDIRWGAIKANVEHRAGRTGYPDLASLLNELARTIGRLKSKVANKYEVEVGTLEHKRKVKLPAPITPVSTALTRLAPHDPKPTEVPHDPPLYFPRDLWPQTKVILLKARKEFPLQTQTLELCKRIISKMTPLFCEAVRAGKNARGTRQKWEN